jgi:hypothetical protein
MAQYEIIYEDGSHSIANYANDAEALMAGGEHHKRATEGGRALLSDSVGRVKATRIVRILKYDGEPGQYNPAQAVSADVAKEEVAKALEDSIEDGVVHLPSLAARIRDISNPFVVSDVHESNYKAEEAKELKLPWQS